MLINYLFTGLGPNSQPHPFSARLVSNKCLTPPTHFQDVRLITLDLQGSNLR